MRESLFVLSARGKVNRQARTGEVPVSACQGLIGDGYIAARERSGQLPQ